MRAWRPSGSGLEAAGPPRHPEKAGCAANQVGSIWTVPFRKVLAVPLAKTPESTAAPHWIAAAHEVISSCVPMTRAPWVLLLPNCGPGGGPTRSAPLLLAVTVCCAAGLPRRAAR